MKMFSENVSGHKKDIIDEKIIHLIVVYVSVVVYMFENISSISTSARYNQCLMFDGK